MTRFRSLFAVAVALMLITAATPAVAQVCMGLPLTAVQTALGLGASFPDGATGYGVGARHKLTDQIVLGAGYTLTSIDEDEGDDIPSQHTFSAGGAYEFLVQGDDGPQLGICPNAGFQYTTWDEINMYAIPLGVSLGTAVEVGDGAAVIAPYANPAIVFGKADIDEIETDWENDFGFTLGTNLIVDNLHFGATYSKVGNGDGVFGIRAGVVF